LPFKRRGFDVSAQSNAWTDNPSKMLDEAASEENTLVILEIKEKYFYPINLCVFNKIAHLLSTMVAKTASIVNGGSQ
jgi:hypothetical protein